MALTRWAKRAVAEAVRHSQYSCSLVNFKPNTTEKFLALQTQLKAQGAQVSDWPGVSVFRGPDWAVDLWRPISKQELLYEEEARSMAMLRGPGS